MPTESPNYNTAAAGDSIYLLHLAKQQNIKGKQQQPNPAALLQQQSYTDLLPCYMQSTSIMLLGAVQVTAKRAS
jgi:hypothetical protein